MLIGYPKLRRNVALKVLPRRSLAIPSAWGRGSYGSQFSTKFAFFNHESAKMSNATIQRYVIATTTHASVNPSTAWMGGFEMSRWCRRVTLFTFLLLAATLATRAQTSVLTQHNDVARTGANVSETVLTTTDVNVSQFGKLFERAVDDEIYGQPLYVSNVNIPNVGMRNVVYVATVNDSVYAFDAENPAATSPLWSVSYINPAAGIVPGNASDVGCNTFQGNIGIVGTPVIEAASQTMYLVARTKESGKFVQRLHAINITNGVERQNSPVIIQASVPGTGDDHNAQNMVPFNSATENQRAALLLANGLVYIAWASYCDRSPYHGWILVYDATTLQQKFVYNATPNGGLGGIWQSGQGLAADASGNIYAVTGNGTFDASTGGSDFGDSFIKLSPSAALLDWFTPFNQSTLDSKDQDLGIQGPLLVPNTNFVVAGGKAGVFYVVNRNNMGHFQAAGDNQIVQSFQVVARTFGSPVYWSSPNNGPMIYLWGPGSPLQAFRLVGGLFQTTPVSQSSATTPIGMPGGMLSLSANQSTPGTGIIWAGVSSSGNPETQIAPGMVRAFDASDVSTELWNSEQNSGRDRLGNFSKFSPPTIANGRVYMATLSNKLVVYGLLANQVGVPSVVNMTQPNATVSLTAAGLVVGTVTNASSATVAAGSVISQAPAAGTQVLVGSSVNLVVSSGPPPAVNVPDVTGATQAAATTTIKAAGLVLGTVTKASSTTVATGLVISQNPVGGSLVPVGSAAALVVSSGNPQASLSPSSLSFGNQKTRTTSVAKKVTLTNSGTTSLNLSGLTKSGNFAFATGTTCTKTTTLAPGANCAIYVTFTPTSKGSKSGSVTITDNAHNSPQSVSLSGSGT